jgi:hypothetical protein
MIPLLDLAEQFFGLFARANAGIWPMQVVRYVLALAAVALAIRPRGASSGRRLARAVRPVQRRAADVAAGVAMSVVVTAWTVAGPALLRRPAGLRTGPGLSTPAGAPGL